MMNAWSQKTEEEDAEDDLIADWLQSVSEKGLEISEVDLILGLKRPKK